MKKIQLMALGVLMSPSMIGQVVYEHFIYPQSDPGDIELRDNIVSLYHNTGDLISAGNYIFGQDSSYATDKVVLDRRSTMGVPTFTNYYQTSDPDANLYNTKVYGVAEDSSGFIMVGKIEGNSHHGSTVAGGGDIVLLNVNANGTTNSAKRIDLGDDDVAYAIVDKTGNKNTFLVCGTSIINAGQQTCFVMEIDDKLNIKWVTEMDLRINSSRVAITELHDLLYDGDDIWAVGMIHDTTRVTNEDGLVVKLNGSGVYQTSKRIRNGRRIEYFYGVENNSNELAIVGKSQLNNGTQQNRLAVLRYTKSTHTIARSIITRTPAGAGAYYGDIGYDIKLDASGTNFYVAGESVSTTGREWGLMSKFNSNLVPTSQALNGNDPTKQFALDIHNVGASGEYITSAGYTASATPRKKGYIIKTDVNLYTGCNDTVVPDTVPWSPIVSNLNDDIDTTFTDTLITLAVDTLLDSLICQDTVGSAFRLASVGEKAPVKVNGYPNPLPAGAQFRIRFAEINQRYNLTLYNSMGQIVRRNTYGQASSIVLNTEGLASGVYLIHVETDSGGKRFVHQLKMMIE